MLEVDENIRTVNPGEVAQTLVPSELKMAALSMKPLPTRLWGEEG